MNFAKAKTKILEENDSMPKSNEEKKVSGIPKPSKLIKSQYIYCYGESPFILRLDCETLKWSKASYNSASIFKGHMRYMSICRSFG